MSLSLSLNCNDFYAKNGLVPVSLITIHMYVRTYIRTYVCMYLGMHIVYVHYLTKTFVYHLRRLCYIFLPIYFYKQIHLIENVRKILIESFAYVSN